MKKWKAVVYEAITRQVEYTVEAETQDEAYFLMRDGVTIEEKHLENGSVIYRHVSDKLPQPVAES